MMKTKRAGEPMLVRLKLQDGFGVQLLDPTTRDLAMFTGSQVARVRAEDAVELVAAGRADLIDESDESAQPDEGSPAADGLPKPQTKRTK